MHFLQNSIYYYKKTLNSAGFTPFYCAQCYYIAWSRMEEFIITVQSLTVCVLLKLMTEALWLLVHLKFSLNFIIQLSLWPWINKLQVSYHEFILHLRQLESGMCPFFPLFYPKNIQLKVRTFFNAKLRLFPWEEILIRWRQSCCLVSLTHTCRERFRCCFCRCSNQWFNIYHSAGCKR